MRMSPAVAGRTYRFLLRMPEDLRQRIVDAAAASGRSLNAELVSRIEASLDAEERPARSRGIHRLVPRSSRGASSQESTSMETPARRRLLAVGVLAALAVAV